MLLHTLVVMARYRFYTYVAVHTVSIDSFQCFLMILKCKYHITFSGSNSLDEGTGALMSISTVTSVKWTYLDDIS